MSIFIPRKREYWQKKPSYLAELDLGHRFVTDDLVFANMQGRELVVGAESDTVWDSDGLFADRVGAIHSSNPIAGEDIRLVGRAKIVSGTADYNSIFFVGHYNSGSDNSGLWVAKNSAGKLEVIERNNSDDEAVTSIGTVSAGEIIEFTVISFATGKCYVSLNDEATQISASNFTRLDISAPSVRFGRDSNIGRENYLDYCHVYKNANDSLVIEAANSLKENPYQILKARSKYWRVPAEAAGGAATLVAASGSYNLVGTPAQLLRDYSLTAAPGTYAVTGNSVGLLLVTALAATSGSYAVTGAAASLLRDLKLAADSGAYTVAGSSASFLLHSVLAAESGSYASAGFDVSLGQDSSISLSSGSYILIGTGANLLTALILALGSGTYAVTGSDANLATEALVSAESGSYGLTGQEAALLKAAILGLESGSYVMAGSDVALAAESLIALASGSYSITGQEAALLKDIVLALTSGSYALTGYSVVLAAGSVLALAAESGAYNLTGEQVSFLQDIITSADSGSYIVNGNPASLVHITGAVSYIRALLIGI